MSWLPSRLTEPTPPPLDRGSHTVAATAPRRGLWRASIAVPPPEPPDISPLAAAPPRLGLSAANLFAAAMGSLLKGWAHTFEEMLTLTKNEEARRREMVFCELGPILDLMGLAQLDSGILVQARRVLDSLILGTEVHISKPDETKKDDDNGMNEVYVMGDAPLKKSTSISYTAAFPLEASQGDISDLLNELNSMESRAYVVHVNPDCCLIIFSITKKLQMMSSSCVWIAPDWLPSVLDSLEPNTDRNSNGFTLRNKAADHYQFGGIIAESHSQSKAYTAAGIVSQNYANIPLMFLCLHQACGHHLLKDYDSDLVGKDYVEIAKRLPRETLINLFNWDTTLAICCVCHDPPEDDVNMVCGHVFCNQCALEYPTAGCSDGSCIIIRFTTPLCISGDDIREGSKALSDVLEIELPRLQKMKPKDVFGFITNYLFGGTILERGFVGEALVLGVAKAEFTEIKTFELKLKLGFGLHGKIHIIEPNEAELVCRESDVNGSTVLEWLIPWKAQAVEEVAWEEANVIKDMFLSCLEDKANFTGGGIDRNLVPVTLGQQTFKGKPAEATMPPEVEVEGAYLVSQFVTIKIIEGLNIIDVDAGSNMVMIQFIPSSILLLWNGNSNLGNLYEIGKYHGDSSDSGLLTLETFTFLHMYSHSHDLEDKVNLKGVVLIGICTQRFPSSPQGLSRSILEGPYVPRPNNCR